VTAWAPAAAPERRLQRALDVTRRRLPRLEQLFGPFGWPDLQVVVTNSTAMEHSALVMTPPTEYIVVHELAHEWWFGTVGDDQAEAPWLDEGFATYAEEAVLGRPPWCRRPGPERRLMTRGVDFFRSQPARYGAAYFEGACLLDLLERRMGTVTFRTALREYAIANRYGWSTAAEFRAAMDAASPRGLGDLWRRFGVQ
jgi:aminopeptidase N